jgi:uncharacterized membrane protein YhaH (DUF805 family)
MAINEIRTKSLKILRSSTTASNLFKIIASATLSIAVKRLIDRNFRGLNAIFDVIYNVNTITNIYRTEKLYPSGRGRPMIHSYIFVSDRTRCLLPGSALNIDLTH